MQIEGNRRATFLGTPAATFLDAVPVKRTAKSKAPVIPTNGPRWPHTETTHPRLTPDELARAGYYYAPEPVSMPSSIGKGKARRTTSRAVKSTTSKASTSRAGRKTKASSAISDTDPSDAPSEDELATQEMDDQCCCFTCGKKLGGWDETDDPYEEHWKRSEGVAGGGGGGGDDEGDDIACAWATAVCSVVIHVKRWKNGSLAGTSGKGTTGKRSKTKQPSVDVTMPYVYPKAVAHLHPQSQLMTRARQQTYHPSKHITSQTSHDGKAKMSDAGWWPHKVKRAWLCTVSNLAKAGFVYTPTTEEKDCVTCFYCNYSVSDWEPTDDPWKQHYDKSPNCPFFTEGIEGQTVDEGRGEDAVGRVDDAVDELADLPTVRSRAAVGSKRPTSRTTVTRARRTITATAPASSALDRSTIRSRIPKSAALTITPRAPRIPSSTSTSDNDDAPAGDKVAKPATKARPQRGTTTTKAPASTNSITRKPRTVKAKAEPAAPSGDDPDDFDELPHRAEKNKSLTRSKSSKTSSMVSASEDSVADVAVVKKASTVRKGKTTVSVQDTDMSRADDAIHNKPSKKAPSPPVALTNQHAPPSPPTTASEVSETEQDEFDAEERAEYLREEEAVKSNRLQMVEAGAKEAMAVLQNLGSKRLNSKPVHADDVATPQAVPTSASISNIDDFIVLTAEEEEMTVVEYVRKMYALRQAALRAAGENKIRDWQEKAKQARDFIQSIPARDQ